MERLCVGKVIWFARREGMVVSGQRMFSVFLGTLTTATMTPFGFIAGSYRQRGGKPWVTKGRRVSFVLKGSKVHRWSILPFEQYLVRVWKDKKKQVKLFEGSEARFCYSIMRFLDPEMFIELREGTRWIEISVNHFFE